MTADCFFGRSNRFSKSEPSLEQDEELDDELLDDLEDVEEIEDTEADLFVFLVCFVFFSFFYLLLSFVFGFKMLLT